LSITGLLVAAICILALLPNLRISERDVEARPA